MDLAIRAVVLFFFVYLLTRVTGRRELSSLEPFDLIEAEVAELMTPAASIEAVEGSFRRLAEGQVENVPRRRAQLEGGMFAVMSAGDPGPGLARGAFVCCDSREQARLESGDLIEPVEAGVLDWLEVHEFQEVVGAELPGRQAEDDIVLFKSNGIAAWDVAAGAAAIELARERGVG